MSANPMDSCDFIATLRLFCGEFEEMQEKLAALENRVQCRSQNCKKYGHGCHKDKTCGIREADHTDHYNCDCDECQCPLCVFEASGRLRKM